MSATAPAPNRLIEGIGLRTGALDQMRLPADQPFIAVTTRYGSTGWYRRVDFVSIFVVTSGEGVLGRVSISGLPTFQRLVPGRLVLLRPDDINLLRGVDPEVSSLSLCYVAFPSSAWQSFAALSGLDPRWATEDEPPSSWIAPDDSEIWAAFAGAVARFAAGPEPFDLMRFWMSVVPRLVAPAERRERIPGGIPSWLADGLAAMQEESNLRGGVSRLLEITHVSSSHLAASTRRYCGRTPTDLVAELRLQHATELLRMTDEGIGEVANRCGFSSLVYFSGRFRAAYGMSPREYRHSLRSFDQLLASQNAKEATLRPVSSADPLRDADLRHAAE